LIEKTGHGGSETDSWIDAGRGVSEVGRQGGADPGARGARGQESVSYALLPILVGSLLVGGCASILPEQAERDALIREAAAPCEGEFPAVKVTGVDHYGRLIGQTQSSPEWTAFQQCFQRRMHERLKTRTLVGSGRLVASPSGLTTTAVPVELSGGHTILSVIVNRSATATMLLDTGASFSILSPRMMKRIGIPVPLTAPKIMGVVVGGGTVSMPYVRIGSLSVGSFTVENIDVGVFDAVPSVPGLDGILGANFLSHFRMTVDQRLRQLTLEVTVAASTAAPPASIAEAPDGWPAPTWTPGDEWKIRWESPTGKGSYVRTVQGEELVEGVAHYVVKAGPRALYYLKENLGSSLEKVGGVVVVRWTPPLAWRWPLYAGKSWETSYRWENLRTQQSTERYRSCEVVGQETVTVAAGIFSTLRLACKDRNGRVVYEAWYAAEAKHWVKERTVLSYGDQWRELESFTSR
jgi:predicted aspartyl protease